MSCISSDTIGRGRYDASELRSELSRRSARGGRSCAEKGANVRTTIFTPTEIKRGPVTAAYMDRGGSSATLLCRCVLAVVAAAGFEGFSDLTDRNRSCARALYAHARMHVWKIVQREPIRGGRVFRPSTPLTTPST